MEARLRDIAKASRAQDDEARQRFVNLSVEDLNWRPDKSVWSIGQQFEHLVLGNRTYVEIIAKLAKQAGPESSPYAPRFWGRMIIAACSPEDRVPAPVPKAIQPSDSRIEREVVDEYFALQDRYHQLLGELEGKDLTLRFTSPYAWFVKLQLGDAIQIVERHNARHLGKAVALSQRPDFPSAN